MHARVQAFWLVFRHKDRWVTKAGEEKLERHLLPYMDSLSGKTTHRSPSKKPFAYILLI